jgi:hypothetical protein
MQAAVAVARAYQELTQPAPEPETFVDKHFAKIAFAVATLALIALAPLDFFVGAIAGFAIHYYVKQPVDPTEKIVTLPHTVLTIVGAVAALIRFTPGGALGGLVFLVIPSIGSLAVGATAYRAFQMAGR